MQKPKWCWVICWATPGTRYEWQNVVSGAGENKPQSCMMTENKIQVKLKLDPPPPSEYTQPLPPL